MSRDIPPLQAQGPSADALSAPTVTPPFWLLAELTYQCPLHCVFCSNPVDYKKTGEELSTSQWKQVFEQARALGAVQLGFSGGEPLQRDDLEELVAHAHKLGFYTNLITSGIGMTEQRARALKHAGLDHVQLSFQDSTREMNDFLSHTRTFDLKKRVAAIIKAQGWPMVMNVVMHRQNLPHIGRIIELAYELGAEYLELANTQYYGWAWLNRNQLIPTREQLEQAETVVNEYRAKFGNRCRILYVIPDYFEEVPKACMNGWGKVFLTIAPDGLAMPCHAARQLPGLQLPSVKTLSVKDIWYGHESFNAFRGYEWMAEPCRACDDKSKDYGGCRCQAWLMTGDAKRADPVCAKSPDHQQVIKVVRRAAQSSEQSQLIFRTDANSRDTAVIELAKPLDMDLDNKVCA